MSWGYGCRATPEQTIVTNNTDQTLNLATFRLTSLIRPSTAEPFTLRGTLAPGAAATFETGTNAGSGGTSLGGNEMYVNTDPNEGARRSTPFGDLTVLCGGGTNSGMLPVASAQPTATPPPPATATAQPAATPTAAATPEVMLTPAPTATIPPTVPAPPISPPPPPVPLATATMPPPTATPTMGPLPGLPNTGAGGANAVPLVLVPIAALLVLMARLVAAHTAGGRRRG